jgi:hypothetical protein
MSTLESRIDDLYRLPIDDFTPARAALAAELEGDEKSRVKQLKKPTGVPWAVNQVYWHARPVFDRTLKTGTALRHSQIAALEGRKADVRGATEAHRQAVSAAIAKAIEIAAQSSVHPDRDALSRTFEALSLASRLPESPGRFTQALQPGGFEMLTGVEPVATVRAKPALSARPSTGSGRAVEGSDKTREADPARVRAEAQRAAAAARARERELAAEARQRDAAIKKAEAALARARENEADAERAWRQAQEDVEAARRALRSLQS